MLEEISLRKVKLSWDADERCLLEMAFQKYGEDHKAIADLLGTKTKLQVQSFFEKSRSSFKPLLKSKKLTSPVVQELKHESTEVIKSAQSPVRKTPLTFFLPQNDSDEDLQQVKDPEMINEIIGVKTPGKTSIMTTSAGKTLKRKHEDDAVKVDDDVLVIADDAVPEKKLAMETLETKSEITITPIPKKADNKDADGAAIPVV